MTLVGTARTMPPDSSPLAHGIKMSFEKAKDILDKALIGNAYSYMDVGDWWRLSFGEYWIVAQNIASAEEATLNNILVRAVPSILDGVDSEYVAKSAIVMRNMRKRITKIHLERDCSLKLTFDEHRHIILTNYSDIVDWQWCLNKSGKDPYRDYIVACFEASTISVEGKELKR